MTNNECYAYPAFLGLPYLDSVNTPADETCLIQYNSIVNNTAKGGYGCIVFDTSGSSQLIDMCNVISNHQSDDYSGTIMTNGNLIIQDSCIVGNNKIDKVFVEENIDCLIYILRCTIDSDITSSTRYTGSIKIAEAPQESYINALTHIFTNNCDSFLDSYEDYTQATKRTPKRTANACKMTCQYKRPMIDPVRCIQFIFIISMI